MVLTAHTIKNGAQFTLVFPLLPFLHTLNDN
jgi:hypothetical protein